jgi:hypothetical protein
MEGAHECGADELRGSCAALDFWLWYWSLPRLEIPVYRMRHCSTCGKEALFHADRLCAQGEVGSCEGCGEWVLAEWTRTNTEAA